MNRDPEMRGTVGNSSGPNELPQASPGGIDLQHVIERVVVRTCFKTPLPGHADAAVPGPLKARQPGQTGQANPSRHERAPDEGSARKAEPSEKSETRTAQSGEAAMADVQRFISVLDKVYSKVLSDGDFDFVGFMRARSLGPSEMLDLLEACAVRLGEEWSCDSIGFVRVVVATSRLQRILRTLSQENRCFEPFACDRSMLLVIPRGESHLFAVSLMEERFRLKGWETRLVFTDRLPEVPHLLQTSDFQLVCITWFDSTLKNQVETVLHAITASVNRERTCVIAGGPAAEEHSRWLEERGVEKICSNAHIAIKTAERLGATRNSAHSAAGINGSLLEPSQSA